MKQIKGYKMKQQQQQKDGNTFRELLACCDTAVQS